MTKLSIVIPAFNERENIRKGCLDEVWNYLSQQSYPWEVLLVDDKSEDNTLSLLKDFSKKHKNFKVFACPHRGKGGTVIFGMLKAQGDIILFTDLDQATPIREIQKLLPKFSQGFDIAIGVRKGRKGAPIIRKLMAYGFTFLRFIILRLPYKDTQCGFKAFKKEAAKKIFEKMKIFSDKKARAGSHVTAGFDLEMLYIARKQRLKVAQIEVNWEHKETERIDPIKDSLEGLKDLLTVRINAFLGKYK
jgi:glycosyltransferase involved in cell wall biosynthesis